MEVLTIVKKEDGSESYHIDDKIIEMFKDHPENLHILIDSIKEKDVKIAHEESSQKKEETKQSGFENIRRMVVAGCSSINTILEGITEIQNSLNSSETSLEDNRSDEEVEEDINKNYAWVKNSKEV